MIETIKGQKLENLWLSGKKTWNQKFKQRSYNLDFTGIDFAALNASRDLPPHTDFSGFIFPFGDKNFTQANFGQSVSFKNAQFSNGDVCFGQMISCKDISFEKASFGDGKKDFTVCTFRKINFTDTNFGSGDVLFCASIFESGADFQRANFSECLSVQFRSSTLHGYMNFEFVKFGNAAYFDEIFGMDKLEMLSFRFSEFKGVFEISSELDFPCMIDLRGTKLDRHSDLSGINFNLNKTRIRKSYFFQKGDWATQAVIRAGDEKPISSLTEARARRLKELAEESSNHYKAKDFQVIELQAMREHKYPYDFLLKSEFYYDKFSDYGRSVTRPLGWLAFVTWLWAVFYSVLSFLSAVKLDVLEAVSKSFIFSFAQIFPFVQASRKAHQDVAADLFGANHDWIYFFTFVESFLGFVLLFLLGLGLRHKYKI